MEPMALPTRRTAFAGIDKPDEFFVGEQKKELPSPSKGSKPQELAGRVKGRG
jgi:hypothetical protein